MKLLFDIGGTKLRRGVLEEGRFALLDKHDTQSGDLKNRLESLITRTLQEYSIDFIGVSFAGQVTNGVIASAPNIALGDLAGSDFPAWIQSRFNLPAAIDNDLKCAALAEAALRPESKALAVLYVGTGLGGALVENGRIIRGSRNLAGEIGHIPFEKAPFICGCGNNNCLELSASGSGVERWCAALKLEAKTLSDVLSLTPRDERAAQIADRFQRGIGHAIQTVAALFNPDTIVLGGGVALGNPEVARMAQAALLKSFAPARNIAIELSTLGDEANLLGAGQLRR